MWEKSFPMSKIEAIRRRIGESAFQTQYMLNPRAAGDNDVFPPAWISSSFDDKLRFSYDGPKYAQNDSIRFIGADFAMSQGPRADYDSYIVVEKIGGRTVLIYGERHRGSSTDAKKDRLRELYRIYKPLQMILDPSSVGTAILNDLRNETLPVREGEFHIERRQRPVVSPTLSVYSTHDNIVHPPTTSALGPRGGTDVAIDGLGHLSLLYSPEVTRVLIEFTEQDDHQLRAEDHGAAS
jgi:hypothetical protein